MLDEGINLCLGTENPLSGSLNIFAEIKTAREIYFKNYNEQLPARTIFKMLTSNPAKALRQDNIGSVESGKTADLLVLANKTDDPYENLCQAELEDVRLVVINGKPVYGDIALKSLFELFHENYEIIKIGNSERLITGSPINLLDSVNRTLGYKKNLAFLPII